MAKTLVFLEHHDGAIAKGSLGVLAKAAQIGGDVAGVLVGSGVRAARRRRRRVRRRRPCGSPTTSASRAPLPQPRVDVLAKLVRDEGFDTVLFAQSVLAADVAAGLAARLDAGPQLGARRLRRRDRQGAAALRHGRTSTSAGRAPSSWRSSAPARSTRSRRRRHGRGQGRSRSSSRTSRRRPRWSSRRTPSSRGRRSRTPT